MNKEEYKTHRQTPLFSSSKVYSEERKQKHDYSIGKAYVHVERMKEQVTKFKRSKKGSKSKTGFFLIMFTCNWLVIMGRNQ